MKKVIKIVLFVLGVAFVALVALRKQIFAADSWLYNVYEEDLATALSAKAFKTLVIVVVGLLLVAVGNFIAYMSNKLKNNTAKTFALLLGSLCKYASFIGIVLVSLSAWGVDTSAIVTGAGVLTLVIGLGCQTLVSDIVSGIFMLFEGDIKVGDVVVVNGWRGTVVQIGLRRTKIEDTVGDINVINNSSISNIINNTQKLSYSICDFGIEYDESIERVESVLKNNFDRIRQNIPALVDGPYYKGVQSLGESCVVIRLIGKVKEDDKFQVQRDLNREVKMIFDENNINIPFNQIVISKRHENTADNGLTPEEIKATKEFVKHQKEISRGIDEVN